MENASKALLIAGAILVSILIVSLGVLIFNRMGGSAKEAANMDEQEVANFNSKITPYVGKNISGSQVNALIQLVISLDNSAKSSGDATKAVSITYPLEAGGTNTISFSGGNVSGINGVKRVKTGSGIYYTVTATYGDNGLINTIVVS
jgi:hypothetical protein